MSRDLNKTIEIKRNAHCLSLLFNLDYQRQQSFTLANRKNSYLISWLLHNLETTPCKAFIWCIGKKFWEYKTQ